MFKDRIKLYEDLETKLNTKLQVYITGDRQGFESQINDDSIDFFINHLDKFGIPDKISLYLYTYGGEISSAWTIINLILQYCQNLEVIVPRKALSAGTLICLGAKSIIMTKQATLGPIDPTLTTQLDPKVPGELLNNAFPVSVEAVKGYLAFAKEELAIKDDLALAQIMVKLSDTIHPLVLGDVYR
jgi:ClpP class serine protease